MNILSKIIIPISILIIVFSGFKKNINIYDSFLEGAKDGLSLSISIFPSIVAMVFAINIFLDSGFIIKFFSILSPLVNKFNIPLQIMPMAFLRPISGTATLAIMNDIFSKYGPDSFVGRLASVLQGCTDTTIYVLALYFGSIGIRKGRYALIVGLFADLIGIIMAFILTSIFF